MLMLYRNFSLFLFLIWLTVTGLVFISAVWGRLDHVFFASQETTRIAAQAMKREGSRLASKILNFSHTSSLSGDPVAEPTQSTSNEKKIDSLFVAEISTPFDRNVASGIQSKTLDDLNIITTGNHVEITLKSKQVVDRINWFNMEKENLTAIDLLGIWTSNLQDHFYPKSGAVKKITIGLHPDRLRISVFFKNQFRLRRVPTFIRTQDGVNVTFDIK